MLQDWSQQPSGSVQKCLPASSECMCDTAAPEKWQTHMQHSCGTIHTQLVFAAAYLVLQQVVLAVPAELQMESSMKAA